MPIVLYHKKIFASLLSLHKILEKKSTLSFSTVSTKPDGGSMDSDATLTVLYLEFTFLDDSVPNKTSRVLMLLIFVWAPVHTRVCACGGQR